MSLWVFHFVMVWSHMSPGSYLNCGRDFPLAQDPFVRIVSLGSKDSRRAWSAIKKHLMFLCYRLTKTFDVSLFSTQTHYSSKFGIAKETSLESKVQCCARLCPNSPVTWTSEFQHCRQPVSAFGEGENPITIFLQMRHDHTFTYTYTHTRARVHTDTDTQCHDTFGGPSSSWPPGLCPPLHFSWVNTLVLILLAVSHTRLSILLGTLLFVSVSLHSSWLPHATYSGGLAELLVGVWYLKYAAFMVH